MKKTVIYKAISHWNTLPCFTSQEFITKDFQEAAKEAFEKGPEQQTRNIGFL